jgi:hypothetical protein
VDADDPDAGDAPEIAPGDPVTWTYVVTNTGNVDLFDVLVTDDQGAAVTCPSGNPIPLLPVNAVETCTAVGVAQDVTLPGVPTVPGTCGTTPNTPVYENMGKATGQYLPGEFVEDEDLSHYCNLPDPCELELSLACLVPQPPTPQVCTERPREIVFEYTQALCPGNNPQLGRAVCEDFGTTVANVADVVITYVGSDAGTITMTSPDGIFWTLSAPDKLQSQSTFEVRDALTGELLQDVSLHTSCSKPLAVADEFGSMKVVTMIQSDGTVIGGVIDPQEPDDELCTVFNDRTECEKRPTALGFRFHAGVCADSSHSQDPGKFDCEPANGVSGQGPFEIRFSDKDGADYVTFNDVNEGDEFEVTAAMSGRSEFNSETFFDVYDVTGALVQSVRFHSSCSQNLFIGDRYGDLEVVSFTNSEQGFVTANNEVELWYTVTNIGTPPINYIWAGDDNATTPPPFFDGGPPAGDDVWVTMGDDDEVAPGDFRVYMRKAQVTADATFTGYAEAQNAGNPAEVCKDDDPVTVLVLTPPTPIYNCTTKPKRKPQALMFEYTGGDCAGSNDQEGKLKCEDFQPLGTEPVQVYYKGKDRKKIQIVPDDESVVAGDPVLLEAIRRKKLHSSSKIEIRRGGEKLQSMEIHTSCSKPLNVGDKFGSLTLKEYIPEQK